MKVAERRYGVIVLALFIEFLNLRRVTWFNAPIMHNLPFHVFIFIVVVSDQNWDHVNCAKDHTKKSNRGQCTLQ